MGGPAIRSSSVGQKACEEVLCTMLVQCQPWQQAFCYWHICYISQMCHLTFPVTLAFAGEEKSTEHPGNCFLFLDCCNSWQRLYKAEQQESLQVVEQQESLLVVVSARFELQTNKLVSLAFSIDCLPGQNCLETLEIYCREACQFWQFRSDLLRMVSASS